MIKWLFFIESDTDSLITAVWNLTDFLVSAVHLPHYRRRVLCRQRLLPVIRG